MSFREKSAWISVLSMSAIYGYYFWSVIHAGPQAGHFRFGGLLLGTIIALVAVQVVLTVAVAIFMPREAKAPRDERDKLIELRAMRVAYAGLATASPSRASSARSTLRSYSTRTPCSSFL